MKNLLSDELSTYFRRSVWWMWLLRLFWGVTLRQVVGEAAILRAILHLPDRQIPYRHSEYPTPQFANP